MQTEFPRSGMHSHRKCSVKIGVLKNFANLIKFESLFNKVAGLRDGLQHGCFPVKFANF